MVRFKLETVNGDTVAAAVHADDSIDSLRNSIIDDDKNQPPSVTVNMDIKLADIRQLNGCNDNSEAVHACKMIDDGGAEEIHLNGVSPLNDVPEDDRTFGVCGDTHEAIPATIFYRNTHDTRSSIKKRPTLAQLHEDPLECLFRQQDEEMIVGSDQRKTAIEHGKRATSNTSIAGADSAKLKETSPSAVKFGWIRGVFVRCLLNIWGVMLFIRLSWVVGQAGIGLASVVILLSMVVTNITTLSMSAICTNGEVRGGGAYYMISRSLGAEFGGAIGVVFSFANAVAVSLYVVGFAETVVALMRDNDKAWFNNLWDVRLIGIITVVCLLGIVLIGMQWEAKVQLVLLVILIVAICSFVIGVFFESSESRLRDGIVGFYNGSSPFIDNFGHMFTPEITHDSISKTPETIFSIFAVFFPAATGILAGANISGDLRDAQRAIPLGTILAIQISGLTYLIMAWLVGAVVLRSTCFIESFSQPGIVNTSGDYVGRCVVSNSDNSTVFGLCMDKNVSCVGMLHSYSTMQMTSAWSPLVTAGIFAATISSALASLVGAPRIFQAVCKDKIFPRIEYFAYGKGPSNDPVRGYWLSFVIAVGFILIGELNDIAPILSNIFLMSYALINYACFAGSMSKSPGWRPAFRYYNKWGALFGAVLCVAVMFIINWISALVTLFITGGLYQYVAFTKPSANWGSASQARTYISSLTSMLKLQRTDDHVKNFRPQFLVLCGPPQTRPDLVRFVSDLSRNVGVMVCGNIIVDEWRVGLKYRATHLHSTWLEDNKIKAFNEVVIARSLIDGAKELLQTSGLGKLKPNTLVVGWPRGWNKMSKYAEDFIEIVHMAFDLNNAVAIVRAGKEAESSVPCSTQQTFEERHQNNSNVDNVSNSSTRTSMSSENISTEDNEKMNSASTHPFSGLPFYATNKPVVGRVDVWWLMDDGGLTILLPYLLLCNDRWSQCTLRVLTVHSSEDINKERVRMMSLLKRFRIRAEVVVIGTSSQQPSQDSIDAFMTLRGSESMTKHDAKTLRHIRVGELLREHSHDAELIFASLPIPRKSVCSAFLYLSWLETLSRDLPTIVLIRGNQSSVLTFHS